MAEILNSSKLPEAWQIDAYDNQKEYWKDPKTKVIYEIEQDLFPENPKDISDSLSTSIVDYAGTISGHGPHYDEVDDSRDSRYIPRGERVDAVIDKVLANTMPEKDIDKALYTYTKLKHLDAAKDDFDEAYDAIQGGYGMPEVFESIDSYTPLQDMAKAGAFQLDEYIRVLEPERSETDQYTDIGAFITCDDVKKEYSEVTPENWAKAEEVMKSEHQEDMDYENGHAYIVTTYSPDGKEMDSVGGFYGQEVFGEIPNGSEKLGAFNDISECIQETKDKVTFHVHDIKKTSLKLPYGIDAPGYTGIVTATNTKNNQTEDAIFWYENSSLADDNGTVHIYGNNYYHRGAIQNLFRNNTSEYTKEVKDACVEFEKQTHRVQENSSMDAWHNETCNELKGFWDNPHAGLSKYWKDPHKELIYEVSENPYPDDPRDNQNMLSTSFKISNGLISGNGRQADYIDGPLDVRFNGDDPNKVEYIDFKDHYHPGKDGADPIISNILIKLMPDEDIDKALHSYADKHHIVTGKDDYKNAIHAIKTGKEIPGAFADINSETPLLDMAKEGAFNINDYVHFIKPEKTEADPFTYIGAFFTRNDVELEFGNVTSEAWNSADAIMEEEHQMDLGYYNNDCYVVNIFIPENEESNIGYEPLNDEGYVCYGQQLFNILPPGSEKLGTFRFIGDCVRDMKRVAIDTEKTHSQGKPSLDDVLKDAEDKADNGAAKDVKDRDDISL